MERLEAFHGEQGIKDQYLARVMLHRQADELVQGAGWENGRGCAVGCTLEAYDHARYPIELGIPEVLAHLEDRIFENLPHKDAMLWPERFLSAPRPGADLSDVWPQFAVWLLVDPENGVIRFAETDQQRAAIEGVAALWRERAPADDPRWRVVRSAAVATAAAAYAAPAYYAVGAFVEAVAVATAAVAASTAAAGYAADAAVAISDHWASCADKLIELLEAA